MWNDNSGFGGGGGRYDQPNAGGGGFLNTTSASPSTSEKKKPERISNVVPCTVAQIHKIPESEEHLKVGSMTAKIVTIVGLVRSVDIQSTKATYVINDYTGPNLEVQMWIGENEDQTKKMNYVQEGIYVRVTGTVRSFKGKRHVIAFHCAPLTSLNELTMHMGEVIHTSMSVAAMDKQNSADGGGGTFETTSLMTTSAAAGSDTFMSSDGRKLSKPQQLVKQTIMNCNDEQGINVREIHNQLKSLTRQSIQEALEFLSNEGHIYSTIDEDHYKSTDCV